MAESISTHLLTALEKTNHLFGRWATEQEDWIESTDQRFERSMEESQCTVQALNDSAAQLEDIRREQDTIKGEQARDVELYQDNIARLIQLKKNLEMKKDGLDAEERAEQAKVEEVLALNARAREQREQAMNELVKGVRFYSMLGLEFQKADRNIMRFIFTQIDSTNPAKPFTFQMYVDESDQYRLVDTVPVLDDAAARALVSNLNEDNDIGKFVCSMRKTFVDFSNALPAGRV
jgi:hypothetical protein